MSKPRGKTVNSVSVCVFACIVLIIARRQERT
jgi:hypothetical protein